MSLNAVEEFWWVAQGAFEQAAVDLARHLAHRPALLLGHTQIEPALLLALGTAEDVQMGRPGKSLNSGESFESVG
jgi:hypothetical protein